MGYGNGQENNLPTTFFKINGLKSGSTEIFFEGKEKKGGEYVTIEAKPTTLSGHLTSVKIKEFEWKEETHKVVSLVIDDANSRVILEAGFSNVMIGIINTLAGNKEAIDKIQLGVYISKTGYPSASIEINGGTWEDNNWKFDYNKKLKPLIEVTKDKKGKVVSTDKSELIALFEKEINSKEFQDKIMGKPPTQAPVDVLQQETEFAEGQDSEGNDPLPF